MDEYTTTHAATVELLVGEARFEPPVAVAVAKADQKHKRRRGSRRDGAFLFGLVRL